MSDIAAKKHEESQLIGILFCEFHPLKGPRISLQDPPTIDNLTPETFKSLAVYIIPKEELQGRLITVNSHGLKIIGFPVRLEDPDKYKDRRNEYIFNLCFVCDSQKRTVQYEPIVKKLAFYLKDLEAECQFVTDTRKRCNNTWGMIDFVPEVRRQLNEDRSCIISVTDSTTIHLKVERVHSDPRPVGDYEVPIRIENKAIVPGEWDLTTQNILRYIDGSKHILRISAEAGVEVNLVKACIQNMIYYRAATLIPVFMYTNVYVTTPELTKLMAPGSTTAKECIMACQVRESSPPTFRSVATILTSLRHGLTLKEVVDKLSRDNILQQPISDIDVRGLITFALTKGFIRRLQRYPVADGVETSTSSRSVFRFFDGNHSFDDICTTLQKTHRELEDIINKPGNVNRVLVIWK